MSNIDYIINLCHDIHASGKKPSVALIKNQSPNPLSMPEIIRALQHWKLNPNQEKKVISQSNQIPKPAKSLEDRVEQLELQLQQVMQELALLQKADK
ncbi:hypothetical protein [Paraglaciecola sp.]|uniref:hypothetical protein n=1 Tax=Paraglaciecola sp. TaxID=1920173 RepID=UPI003EF4AC97